MTYYACYNDRCGGDGEEEGGGGGQGESGAGVRGVENWERQ